jgi:hypothetical protein
MVMFTKRIASVFSAAALVGTAMVALGANPASAITLTRGGTTVAGQGQFSSFSDAKTIDFENGAPSSGFATYSATNGIVQNSVGGEYAAPADDTTKYLTISPKGDNVAGGTGEVTINFAKALDYFGLHWGSVDTYNFIDFFSNGSLVQSFSGSDVPGAKAIGDQLSSTDNVFVNFLADKGQSFDKVVMRSNGRAFETDNHAYRQASVPEPSSMLGLLAVGGVATSSMLKRKREQETRIKA